MQDEQKRVITENIRRLLNEHNMTQSDLAEKIGIAKSTMSDYMNYRAKPGAGVLEKMAVVFGVSKADIDTTYKNKQAAIVDGTLQLIKEDSTGHELVKLYLANQAERMINEEHSIQPERTFNEEHLNYSIKKIPIIGKIAAGTPIEAIQDFVDWIIPPYDTNNINELFGLVVNGESMNRIVPNGHYAVLKKQEEVENGEIAAVIVNGDYATLKKVYRFTDLIVLEPYSYDPSFKDQQYSSENCEEVKVIGKFLYSVSPMINN